MLYKDIKGFKFPDEYTVRFFFREKLDRKRGKILELGSSNGNNLMLFYQYGWNVTGIDIDGQSIKLAKKYFADCKIHYRLQNDFCFVKRDMVDFASRFDGKPYDVLLLASSLYYLSEKNIINLLTLVKKNCLIHKNSYIYLRIRTPKDYRYGKGKKLGEKSFKLTIGETGEKGSTMTFFTESELMALLNTFFEFQHYHLFRCLFDYYKMNVPILNSDLIFWGKIKNLKI